MRLQRVSICAIELVAPGTLRKPLPGERNDRVDLHGRSMGRLLGCLGWMGAPLIARTRLHVGLCALLVGLRCR